MRVVCQFPLSHTECHYWPLEAEREPAEKKLLKMFSTNLISGTWACCPPVAMRRVSKRVEWVAVLQAWPVGVRVTTVCSAPGPCLHACGTAAFTGPNRWWHHSRRVRENAVRMFQAPCPFLMSGKIKKRCQHVHAQVCPNMKLTNRFVSFALFSRNKPHLPQSSLPPNFVFIMLGSSYHTQVYSRAWSLASNGFTCTKWLHPYPEVQWLHFGTMRDSSAILILR